MHFLHYEYKDHRYSTSLDKILNLTSAMCTKQPWRAWLAGMCEKGNARWRGEKRPHLMISSNYCSLNSSKRSFLSSCFVRSQKETTRSRCLKCQGLWCVPCSLFSRRFSQRCFIYTTSHLKCELCIIRNFMQTFECKSPSFRQIHEACAPWKFELIWLFMHVFCFYPHK